MGRQITVFIDICQYCVVFDGINQNGLDVRKKVLLAFGLFGKVTKITCSTKE